MAPDTAPDTVASGTRDAMHARAEGSGSVNQFRLSIPRSAWELCVAAVLALSILVNVWALWTIRDFGTTKWLHDWDLNQFESGPFSELKTEVEVNKQLILTQCKR